MIQQHKDPIESEIQGRVSTISFQKSAEKETSDDLIFKAYSAAYWLVKEKV